jgi:hypothetical protein
VLLLPVETASNANALQLWLSIGLEAAQESVHKLVPDEARLRFFQRVFKWVVAFATWRYGEARARLREGHGFNVAAGNGVRSPGKASSPTKKANTADGTATPSGPVPMVSNFCDSA